MGADIFLYSLQTGQRFGHYRGEALRLHHIQHRDYVERLAPTSHPALRLPRERQVLAHQTHNSVSNSSHRAHSGLMEHTTIPMEPYGAAMAEKGTEKEPLLDKTNKMSHNHDPIPPCQPKKNT